MTCFDAVPVTVFSNLDPFFFLLYFCAIIKRSLWKCIPWNAGSVDPTLFLSFNCELWITIARLHYSKVNIVKY